MPQSCAIVSVGSQRLKEADQLLVDNVGATLMPLIQSKLLGMECHITGMSIAFNTADVHWPAFLSGGSARLTLCIYKNCTGPLMVDFDGGDLGCHTINLTAPGDFYVQQARQLKGWQEMRNRMSGIKCMLVSIDLR